MLIDRNELEASICRESFYDFVQTFWHIVVPEDPVWNWHIELLCGIAQEAAERVIAGLPKKHDLVINIPPGCTKSTIFSVMLPVWMWTRMPTARTICASYSSALALVLSRRSRDIVKSDLWTRLFGAMELCDDQDTKGHFENLDGGSRFAVGTNGTVTGMHGHIIVVDDPVNPEKATSKPGLEQANRFVCETLSRRKVDSLITLTIIVMQRLHQNDPSAKFLEKAVGENGLPVLHINLPAEIGPGGGTVQPPEYAEFYVDGLLDPVRLPRMVLTAALAELGQYGYAGQMLQRPVPPGGGMFKTGRITVDQAPTKAFFKQQVRYWDKAATPGGGCWTVGAHLGRDNRGRFWILDIVRGQWDSHSREAIIKQTAVVDGVKSVIIGIEQEPGSGGKESAQNTVSNLAGFRIRVDKPTGNKVRRADPFSVQVNAGNVYMQKADWNAVFLDEMKNFPNSTTKDQVDASAGAFNIMTRPRIRVGAL